MTNDASGHDDGTMAIPDLDAVCERFRLGRPVSVAYLATGIMNRNWRLEAAAGTFAVKQLLDVAPDAARRSAAVCAALAATGLPACPPVLTRDGDPVLVVAGRAYLVSPWARGEHVEGTALPVDDVAGLGILVGRIHQALNDADRVPLGPVRRPVARVTDPDAALVNANRLLSVIADIPEPTAFDDQARQFLEQRMILIDKHRSAQPAAGELSGMYGWTHGDLQYRNILRDGDGVSAVLDWDRVAVKPLAEEVARTAQVQFGGEEGAFDLDRVAAFAAGYRSAVPLPVGDLADAVHRLWWKRLTDYWTFEYHYDRGDTGPDPLMAPGEQLLAWWTERRDEVDRAFIAGA